MVNHFLADKTVSKTIIVENEKIIDKDRETAEVFNAFFFNIVGIDIAEWSKRDPLANKIVDLVLEEIIKYRNYPSMLKIGEASKM